MSDDIFARLSAPFAPEQVSWRVGSTNIDKQTNAPRSGQEARGLALAYISARDVMDRLDDVVGPSNWQRRHPHVGGTTTCELDIWIEGRGWITKSDGAGDTDVEAEKGSLSDSFKRAAVSWGVGRYLYSLDSPWVSIEPMGRSWKIKAGEYPKLRALLTGRPALKRLTSLQAKERKLDETVKTAINACETLDQLAAWDRDFDKHTAQMPMAWLDAIKNQVLLRKDEIIAETGEIPETRQDAHGNMVAA